MAAMTPVSASSASKEGLSKNAQADDTAPNGVHLPVELKRLILSFADTQTLVNASRVSLAFLEICSPLLYRDVEIGNTHNVAKLFESRLAQHRSPQISPLLSLNQLRTFTYIIDQIGLGAADFNFILTRLYPAPPISVESLTIIIPPKSLHFPPSLTITPHILPLFDPRQFTFAATGVKRPLPLFGTELDPQRRLSNTWTRLSRLTLVGSACLHGHVTLDTRWFGSGDEKLVVRFEFPQGFPSTPTTEGFWIVARALVWKKGGPGEFPNERADRGQVVVRTEQEAERAKEFLWEVARAELVKEDDAEARMECVEVLVEEMRW